MEFFLTAIIFALLFFIIKNSSKIFAKEETYKNFDKGKLLGILEDAKNQGIEEIDDLINAVYTTQDEVKAAKKTLKHIKQKTDKKADHEEMLNGVSDQLPKQNYKINYDRKEDEEDPYKDIPKYAASKEDEKFLKLTKPVKPKINLLEPIKEAFEAIFHILKYVLPAILFILITAYFTVNWVRFDALIKLGIIVFVISVLYIFGILLRHRKRGQFIINFFASSLPIIGPLIWLVVFKNDLRISFLNFWLFYSLILGVIYTFTCVIANSYHLKNLIIFSLYSFFVSLSLIFFGSGEATLLLTIFLNLAVYIVLLVFLKIPSLIHISRLLNQILSILSILFVLSNISIVTESIAIGLIIFPIIFDAISYFYAKDKLVLTTMLLLPLKLYILTDLIVPALDTRVMIFVTFGIIISFIEYLPIFKDDREIVSMLGNSIKWTLAVLISLIIVLSNPRIAVFDVSPLISIVGIFCVFMMLILPEIIKKSLEYISVALSYLVFVAFQIQTFLNPESGAKDYFWIISILTVCAFSFHAFYLILSKLKKVDVFLPLVISTIFTISLLAIYLKDAVHITFVASLITLISFSYSIIYKKEKVRIITTFSIIFSYLGFLFVLDNLRVLSLSNYLVIGGIISLPLVAYAILWDFLRSKNKYYTPELIGLVIFSACMFLYSIQSLDNLIAVSIVFLLYFIYALFKFQKQIFSVLIFFFANLSLILTLYIFRLDFYYYLFYVAILNLVLNLISYMIFSRKIIFKKVLSEQFKGLFEIISVTSQYLSIIYILFLLYSLTYPIKSVSYLLFVSLCLLVSLNLFIPNNVNKWISKIAATPMLIAAWYTAYIYNLNLQFYIFPAFLYLLYLSYIYKSELKAPKTIIKVAGKVSKKGIFATNIVISKFIEFVAYFMIFGTLIAQSIYEKEMINIYAGIFLICISLVILGFGMIRKNKYIIVLSLFVILVEVIIRLYIILAGVPVWTYLIVAALIAFDLAMFVLWKMEKKGH